MTHSNTSFSKVYVTAIIGISLTSLIIGSFMVWVFSQSLQKLTEQHIAAYLDMMVASTVLREEQPTLLNKKAFLPLPRYWKIIFKGNTIAESQHILAPFNMAEIKEGLNTLKDKDGADIIAVKREITFPGPREVTYLFGIQKSIIEAWLNDEQQTYTNKVLLFFIAIVTLLLIISLIYIKLLTHSIRKEFDAS